MPGIIKQIATRVSPDGGSYLWGSQWRNTIIDGVNFYPLIVEQPWANVD